MGDPVKVNQIDLDEPRDWYFTFGYNQGNEDRYVVIHGSYVSARTEMFKRYGTKWSMQYSTPEAAGVNEFLLTRLEK